MKHNILRHSVLFLLLFVTGGGLWAQAPSGYYNNANGKTGDELKSALHEIIKNHQTVSYAQLLNAFAYTDCDANGKIWDIYSNYQYELTDNGEEFTQEGQGWNREHTWPQSWFNEQTTPRSDLFHVYPTDGYVNGRRSNYPYGEVNNPTYTSGNSSKLGPCVVSGYSGTVFEPIDEYKGDIARSYFYMSVRYYTEDDSWGTSAMTNKSEIEDWAMTMLLRWSEEDPVSDKEINRNNAVYGYQNNRNPFIDHPEYARMIWDPNWHGGGSVGAGDFVKVTSTDDLTDGNYLIICENNNVAFKGSLTDLDEVGNTIGVTITNGVIAASDETNAAYFTITAKSGGGYSIKSASGKYIGQNSDANGLQASETIVYSNTITYNNNGSIDIVGAGGAHLRYNANSDQTRFRYFKSSTYTSQQAIQLYKKIETYSITLSTVEHGSISANDMEASEGSTITLTATPESGYELDYWMVTDANNNVITVTNNQFEMPASNVTVSAVFNYVGVFDQQYYLVTDASQLVAGRTYLIVNKAAGKALGTTQNTNNRAAVDVTIENNVIESIGNSVCELTLGGSTGAWTFKDGNVGYLYAVSSSNNYLRTQATNDANGQWSISFDNNGMASIVAQGSNTRNNLRYNPNGSNDPLFSCYASTSDMALVQLFIRSEEYNIMENTTIANLFPFDKHTVHSGATLTVSGTATCNDASQLIIEDGAQLVHHNDGVQATVKKSITGYSGNGGWYTIASPMASPALDQTNMTNANYDLYAYDEDADKEWINQKAHPSGFGFVSGSGYLYAHNPSLTLRMSGALNNGNHSQTVNLSYGNSDENLRGFNLLGNPTAHDITFTKSANVADGYYYLNYSDAWVYATGSSVPVGRGFMVKADGSGQTVTLNPQSKGESREKGQYLCLSLGEDKAYVKLNEGVSMPLFELNGQHAAFYLTQGQKRFAMLVRDGAEALDISFETRHNGMQTLSVDTQGLDLAYLHLIDNLTGADIDLLQTPEYVFNARTSDYVSRFRLVFSANDEGGASTGSATFAFVSNGEIVINGVTDNATLQIIDMMGRVIVSREAVRHISTSGIPAGVYVLRLVDADGVRIQKIVID